MAADSPAPAYYEPPEVCDCEEPIHDVEATFSDWHVHCWRCDPDENPWERDDDD